MIEIAAIQLKSCPHCGELIGVQLEVAEGTEFGANDDAPWSVKLLKPNQFPRSECDENDKERR